MLNMSKDMNRRPENKNKDKELFFFKRPNNFENLMKEERIK